MDIDVDSVANLARLKVDKDEVKWYESQLNDVMTEIKKILDVKITTNDFMICPSDNINCYTDDTVSDTLPLGDVLKNAKNTKDKFITVPRSVND